MGVQPLRQLVGHTGSVNAVSFGAADELVLTGSDDNTARIWDATTGQVLKVLKGHDAPVTSAVFSPDSSLVLTASHDNTVRIWNRTTGEELKLLHKAKVWRAIFSNDGKLVLTTAWDNSAAVWDPETGAVRVLEGHEGQVNAAVFSPDGKHVLTASKDRTARLWDSRSGAQLLILRGHEDAVNTVSFDPDGKLALTASDDNKAFVWNADTGEILRALADSGGMAAFSPDGRLVLTVSKENPVFDRSGRIDVQAMKDNSVRLWDTATGNPITTLNKHGKFVRAQFSPDGKLVLTTPSQAASHVWDASTGALLTLLRAPRAWIEDSVFGSSGKLIASRVTPFGEEVLLWSATPPLPILLQYWRASTARPMTPKELAQSGLTETRRSEKIEGSWQQCNALAAHPFDPERIGAGVPPEVLDYRTAIGVCEKALAEHPGTPQILYQLGRAQHRAADAASDKARKKS